MAPKTTLSVWGSRVTSMISAVRQVVLELLDPALDEALLLPGGVVLGVLAQVAVGARLGDRLDDARPVLALEPLELERAGVSAPFGVNGLRFISRTSL